MNALTSRTRGFFEVLMPGIFLVLNVALTAYLLASAMAPELLPAISSAIAFLANPAIVLSLLVVLGYPVGVVLRLLKNANIDARSARYIGVLHPKYRDALWRNDEFFYPNWMREKCKSRLPAEAARFYEEYWGDKDTGSGRRNTTFFNFCKTVVAKYDPQSGNEIYDAEALCRFLAGSYYALQASVFLMLLNAFCVFTSYSLRAALLPLLFAGGHLYLLHVILSEYRLLRCKEVDTVFNACFANREHFDGLFPTHASRSLMRTSRGPEYDTRMEVILNAWNERWTDDRLIHSVDLQKLISLMKGGSPTNPYLSSLYFAGSDVDHPFFLENTKVAMGLAVLPEGVPKARSPKQHPHQTEIVVVLDGAISVHYENNGRIAQKTLQENDHFVIPEGTCHWISCVDGRDAAYLFVKTNPSEEPRSQPCHTMKTEEDSIGPLGARQGILGESPER